MSFIPIPLSLMNLPRLPTSSAPNPFLKKNHLRFQLYQQRLQRQFQLQQLEPRLRVTEPVLRLQRGCKDGEPSK